jgi:hypothetical protein
LYPAPRRKRSGLAGLRAATSANGSTFIAAADLAALEAFVTDGASKAEARRLAEVFDFTVPPGSHWYEGNAYKWRLATIDDPEAVEEDDDGKLTITATRDVVWRLHKGDDWVSVADPQGILDDHSLDPADYITVVDELEDFWEHPTRLYHATTEDAAEDIVVEGLLPMSGSRGLRNRGVGKAVFTTLNEEQAHHGPYGDVVFEIDTKAMARDGYTPEVSQEPDVVEAEALNALASALNVEDFVSESENDRETVIVYGAIPAKYLRRAD